MSFNKILITAFIVFFGSTELFAATSDEGSLEMEEAGAYQISIGLFRPEFSEVKNYEDFYGSPGVGPSIMVEHFPWEFAVTLGYSVRISYFQDSGHAAVVGSDGELNADKSESSDFSMLPVQIALNLIATPFPQSKWFTLSGWFGFERTMFNESRRQETSSESTTEDSNKVFTNFGFKNATVVGGSLNILIKGKSSNSVVDVLGMRRIFLSPYVEVVQSSKKEGLQLGGSRVGLAFRFELDDK